MVKTNKTKTEMVFITIKGWDCYDEFVDDNEQSIKEYLEWVKKNTGVKRLHYTINGRGL